MTVCRVPNRRGTESGATVAALLAVFLLVLPPGFARAQAPRLFYEQDGHGATVILIPDWAHDTGSWFRVLPPLREDGWRLVRYDLRGQGRSDAPADGDYSLAAHRDDLLRLLDGLGIEQAHLVGTGLGAAIALGFAVDHPERVLSVAAIDPRLGWSDAERKTWEPLLAAWERVGRPTLGEYASLLVARWLGSEFAERNPWIVPWYDLMLRRQSATELIASQRAWLAAIVDLGEEPSRVPVLLVAGERWEGEAGVRASGLARVFPGAWRERLDDSRAEPALDAPAELAQALTEFLDRADPDRP